MEGFVGTAGGVGPGRRRVEVCGRSTRNVVVMGRAVSTGTTVDRAVGKSVGGGKKSGRKESRRGRSVEKFKGPSNGMAETRRKDGAVAELEMAPELPRKIRARNVQELFSFADFDDYRTGLVLENLSLVELVAKQSNWYRSPHYEDLMQDGFIALLFAARSYDRTKGLKFVTYASYWIKQAMSRGHWKTHLMTIPHGKYQIVHMVRRASSKIEAMKGTPADADEVAAELGWSVSKVKKGLELLSDWKYVVSMDEPQPTRDGGVRLSKSTLTEVLDTMNDDGTIAACESERLGMIVDLDDFVNRTLSDLEKEILKAQFGLDGHSYKSPDELAESLGVSRKKVISARTRAMAKLRRNKQELAHYLEDL